MVFAVCGGLFLRGKAANKGAKKKGLGENLKKYSGFRFILGWVFIVSITGRRNAYGKYDF